MANILSFDSLFIVKPLRKLYINFVSFLSSSHNQSGIKVILYRLDQDNLLLRKDGNLSGISIGIQQSKIDALSIEFYKHLTQSTSLNEISIHKIPLLQLYTRQTKLKLMGVLNCIHRLEGFCHGKPEKIQIITDKQTVSIMNEAVRFLDREIPNLEWKTNFILTSIISLNSLFMRVASLITMHIRKTTLPDYYYFKNTNQNLPTALLALPRRRPEDFYTTYVEELERKFNIILYSHGFFSTPPKDYLRKTISKRKLSVRGLFSFKTLLFNHESYIADILIIFKYHFNLNRSINVVDSLYSNKIDILINRQQTNVIDNYLAIKAKNLGIFILGDLFEEIFFCDALVCSSESQNTESVKLALPSNAKVHYKGSNSLIKYRLKAFEEKKINYLKNTLEITSKKDIIFYASDPSKEESQRYLSEKFLIQCFSNMQDYILVIKTHTQDNGKITHYSYCDADRPTNVHLIGDVRQKGKMASSKFRVFENFDFNAAISSSNAFLTTSSSSVLQALSLGVKSGIVDQFDNGYYEYLIKYNACAPIKTADSLTRFLHNQESIISDEVLSFCGLIEHKEHFDMSNLMLNCLNK